MTADGYRSEIREADGSFEATARIVDADSSSDDERIVEAALRPKRLAEFPGQPRVRDQLGLVRLTTSCCRGLLDWARPPWP